MDRAARDAGRGRPFRATGSDVLTVDAAKQGDLTAFLNDHIWWVLAAAGVFAVALVVMVALRLFGLLFRLVLIAAVFAGGAIVISRLLKEHGLSIKEAIGAVGAGFFGLWLLNDILGGSPRRFRRGRDGYYYED